MNSVLPTGLVRLSTLAKSCCIPETTLRRRLNFAGIPIPAAGFRPSRASKIRRLVHASGLLSGWNLVAEFSSQEADIKIANEQATKFRKECEALTALLTKN